jgi:hypothetical protein
LDLKFGACGTGARGVQESVPLGQQEARSTKSSDFHSMGVDELWSLHEQGDIDADARGEAKLQERLRRLENSGL